MVDELDAAQAAARERRTFLLGYWLFFGAFPLGALALTILVGLLTS